ncbi:adenosylcobinamide-GDP ribazoletransferase [Candidatus Poribacteria bacterium]|nr:adenosylcobinamide-GDP ribazoletransferase [Candidatus Poribacteria bacterium]
MQSFFIALQFLTILPVEIKSEIRPEDFGKALIYFPIIGLLIGIFLALIFSLFNFFPGLVLSAMLLIVPIIITGGIHLDGLADTCDGLYGFKPKEKILEIMRDSHIGAMGAIGIAASLILKFSLLSAIKHEILWKLLILMPLFARWVQVLACYSSNYARNDGKAKYFMEYADKNKFIITTIFTFLIFLLLLKIKGIILFSISIIQILIFMNYIKMRIDGMTGDTIGAISEIAEIAILFLGLIII